MILICGKTYRTMVRSALLAGVGASLAMPGIAAAKANGADPQPAPAAKDTDAGRADDVIIVTAQKREERSQDVSASISAFNEKSLARGGITDVSRLALLVPGANFSFTGNDAKLNVRGSNSNNTFGDNTSTVGIFFDDIYKPRASQLSRAFFDVSRVEFLKGPQGTLYGRNTLSGALNVYSNVPDLKALGGNVTTTYSRFNRLRLEGAINIPLSDTFGVRVAGFHETSDGYVKNRVGPDQGAKNERGVRVSARWKPDSETDIVLRFHYLRDTGRPLGLFAYTGTCRPVTADGLTDAAGAFLDCQNPRRGGAGTTPWNLLGPYTVEKNFVPKNDIREVGVSLDAKHSFGPVNFRSITSYTNYRSLIGNDADYGPIDHQREWTSEANKSYTQEVQLSSNYHSALQWTLGAYYSKDKTPFEFYSLRLNLDQNDLTTRPIANPIAFPTLRRLNGTPVPSTNINLNSFSATEDVFSSKYFGAFGQAVLSLSDRLRVIGGLRYNWEKKRDEGGSQNNGVVTLPTNLTPVFVPDDPRQIFGINLDAPGLLRFGRTYKKVTWKAAFEYNIKPDIMFYGTTGTGFQSGTVGQTSATNQLESRLYELGIKSVILDRRLVANLSAYRTTYTNLLTLVLVPDPSNTGVVITRFVNGGDIKANGVELELVYTPTNALRLSLLASVLDAKFGSFSVRNPYQLYKGVNLGASGNVNIINVAGETPPWSPDYTITATASYIFDLGSRGTLTPAVQFFHSDDFTTNGNAPLSIDPSALQRAYSKTDLRLSWESVNRTLSAEVFVENLENTKVRPRTVVGGDNIVQTQYEYPRNFGVKLKARF